MITHKPPETPPAQDRIVADLDVAVMTARLAEDAWTRCAVKPSAEAIAYGQWRYAVGRADALRETLEAGQS